MDSSIESFRKSIHGSDVTKWVANVETKMWWEKLGRSWIPFTQNCTEYESSYVVSAYAALVLYAKQEIRRLPRFVHWVSALLWPLSVVVKFSELNKALGINNWLLSTNMYPDHDENEIVDRAMSLAREHRDYSIILRSLNPITNSTLIRACKKAGFVFLPSRQIYLFDSKDVHPEKFRDFKRDSKLLAKGNYIRTDGASFDDKDFARIELFYKQLYLDKYSGYNPQFTAEFFKLCQKSGRMDLIGLRDKQGELQGFLGLFALGRTISVPYTGYNMTLPQEEGLYRMLMSIAIQEATTRGLVLNLSGGASKFKRNRGGKPVIEYSAVYFKHLPLYRRVGFQFVRGLLNFVAVPLLKFFKL